MLLFHNTYKFYSYFNLATKVLTFLTSFSWWKMYSNSAFASPGLAAYLDMLRRARLINGPSGVDSMDA